MFGSLACFSFVVVSVNLTIFSQFETNAAHIIEVSLEDCLLSQDEKCRTNQQINNTVQEVGIDSLWIWYEYYVCVCVFTALRVAAV